MATESYLLSKRVTTPLPNVNSDKLLASIEKIFHPEHIGAIYISDIINGSFVKQLRKDVEYLDRNNRFTMARSMETNGTTQNLSYFYIEPGKNPISELENLPGIRKLAEEYTCRIYNPIAEFTKQFEPVGLINSIAINRYPAEGGHISYHQDYGYNRNMIGVISVEGTAKSSIALSNKGKEEQSYIVTPGSLMLMRAPFDNSMDEEGPELWCTWHKTETQHVKRYCILLRHINEEMKKKMSDAKY